MQPSGWESREGKSKPVEKSSAIEAGDAAPSGEESQSKGAADSIQGLKRQTEERLARIQQSAANEEGRRQEEADLADFKRQLRAVDKAKAAARTYTVQSGDSLSAIALSVYSNARRWPEIFEANKDQISNPNLIHPGQELRIP